MPNASSFFNLLDDLTDKYPNLKRKEIVIIGSYIWKQLTWEEKYPYMVKAWRSKRKHISANESTAEIKSNFVSRLVNHVATTSEVRTSHINSFLRIMSNKIWNLLMALSNPTSNNSAAESSKPSPFSLKNFIDEMRRLRKRKKSKRRSRAKKKF